MMRIRITPIAEISVPPLTEEETKWIKSLQRVLNKCPARLELVTIGDPSLSIISNEKYSDLSDGAAFEDGVELAVISGKPKVHGVSG